MHHTPIDSPRPRTRACALTAFTRAAAVAALALAAAAPAQARVTRIVIDESATEPVAAGAQAPATRS